MNPASLVIRLIVKDAEPASLPVICVLSFCGNKDFTGIIMMEFRLFGQFYIKCLL